MTGIRDRVIPAVAAVLIRLLRWSLRVRHYGAAAIDALNRGGRNYLLAFWHGQLLLMVYCRYRRPIRVLISRHGDGELIARTMGYFGVSSSRGSTTRGGSAALRDLVRAASDGENIVITPDGPRGPRRIAQMGIVTAAQMTGLPVIPVAFVAKKKLS